MRKIPPSHSAPKQPKVSKLPRRNLFCIIASTLKTKRGDKASSNSPVPLCTCWLLSLENRAWSGNIAAQRRSSTWPEKPASSAPSGAVLLRAEAGFVLRRTRSHRAAGSGVTLFKYTQISLFSSGVFSSPYTLFFLQPRADNTTRYHVTLNSFSAACPSTDDDTFCTFLSPVVLDSITIRNREWKH